MVNSQASDTLPSHPANSSQLPVTASVSASWLAVEAGSACYLIPLGHAGEIFPWTQPQPVPYTEPWFLGVANLRGGVYGVIGLSAFVAGADVPMPNDINHLQARLVALNDVLEVNCALQIDRLIGLRGVDAFTESRPATPEAPVWLGPCYTDPAGVQWQEINLQALSQQPRFLSIGA